MIVAKAPLRVSFLGGGSDIPEYYEQRRDGGLVLSTAIDKYIYIAVNRCVADHIRLVYSETEHVTEVEDLKHDIVREALLYFGLTDHIEITSFSDVPTRGTGLGSSSTFTVALVAALHQLAYGYPPRPEEAASIACHIEIERCRSPIGKQDQYAAAFGGMNEIRFKTTGVSVERFNCPQLEDRLLFFNTGTNRLASSVLADQVNRLVTKQNAQLTTNLVTYTTHGIDLLIAEKYDEFGALLDAAWETKKQLATGISNDQIDHIYAAGKSAGALGGKLLGAGAGGYMMFYVPDDATKQAVRSKMIWPRFEELSVKFNNCGVTTTVI